MHDALLCEWIAADPQRMRALRLAAELDLPDWCIGAGFVRNLAWDRLHRHPAPTPLADIDLIYFDPAAGESGDAAIEAALRTRAADLPWSVRNQARMHVRNGDRPYRSTADAMRHWVEVETAVGVAIDRDGQLRVVAPFGLDSLLALRVTPNPMHRRPGDFSSRWHNKNWLSVWPRLQVIVQDGNGPPTHAPADAPAAPAGEAGCERDVQSS